MADISSPPPDYDEKRSAEDSIDKQFDGEDDVDVLQLKEEEALEERIANDEATENDYRVEAAYEVAIKVCSLIIPVL